MTGLYFYKLVSPYQDDVTKDCKLTVTEIDHNFVTLKGDEIDTATFDAETKHITLSRKNGTTLTMDLSPMTDGMTTNLDVTYDSMDGVIILTYNDKQVTIDGLITKDNLSKQVLTKICTDSTINGLGTIMHPLRLSDVEKTGVYKSAIKLIDTSNGDKLPSINGVSKGDRYVTLEQFSEYGYLYNYDAVKRINEDLQDSGWRIPTKEDWDNMLNAIEPCEYRNHDSLLNNKILGKIGGKLLKSKEGWGVSEQDVSEDTTSFKQIEECEIDRVHPQPKPLNAKGVDSFGMGLKPSGYAFGCHQGHFCHFGIQGAYWTSTMMYETDVYSKVFDDKVAGVVQIGEKPSSYLSIRLVRDYDGKNHRDVENINGINYKTVLMPSLNTDSNYTIWTAANLSFGNCQYPHLKPNNGNGINYTPKYIINEWTGFEWERKEMSEGDGIVLLEGLNGYKNEEFRITNGDFISVTESVKNIVLNEIRKDLVDINVKIDNLENILNEHSSELEGMKEKISNLHIDIENEIIRATNEEIRIEAKVDSEIERSVAKDEEVDMEIKSLHQKDEEIEAKLDSEIERSIEKDEEITNKLINVNGSLHSVECAKGVLTLYTNDGTPITIKLDSNYGTF